MELYSNEYEKLKTQIGGTNGKNGWIQNRTYELEATFGVGGQVDQTSFLAVAQRLKAKGYTALPPVDYMTITIKHDGDDISVRRDTLKNNTRFTIEGTANVEEYCRNESLDDLDYDVIVKTAIGNPNEDNLVLDDFEMKFKVRREEEKSKDEGIVQRIVDNWENEMKAFRLIRRWSFEGDACRFDLSMVRSNKRNSTGAYIFTTTFNNPDQNIIGSPPSYEVEVELIHGDETDTVDKAVAKLIKGVGEVLRGIQRNSVLIRKPAKEKALKDYKALVGTDEFRGVKPRTLEMKNFIVRRLPNTPNIRDGYNVTDKADGLRVLGYCNAQGELFMIDKNVDKGGNVYRTGLMNEKCANSLVDGEWITSIKDPENPEKQKATQQLWLFDIYYAPGKVDVSTLPFFSQKAEKETRYQKLRDWYAAWIKDGPTSRVKGLQAGSRLIVNLKHFEFASKDDTQIFEKAAIVLRRKTGYNTDGLIFTSNEEPLPGPNMNFPQQFKWKPAEDNTIDFYVRIEKDPNDPSKDLVQSEIRSDTNELVEYKKLILKVGSTTDPACANPRDTILYKRPLPKGGCKSDYTSAKRKYTAVTFNPAEYADPLAGVCKVKIEIDPDTGLSYIQTEKSDEQIRDKSIIEMRYDMKQPDGWKWIPVRVRADKTERLDKGELGGTLNAERTAESIWNSIHNPITKGMITTGSEVPLVNEMEEEEDEGALTDLSKPYFQRKANKEQLLSVEGLRNYHKHHIKGELLLKPTLKGGDKYILDLAVGEAADINRWIANNVGFVYGIDVAAKGIIDSKRGAYSKYLSRVADNAALPESQQIAIAPMIFGIGDVSKDLASGKAGYNDDEANILRAVFGKYQTSGAIPPFVQDNLGKLKEGADVVSCMFALHYFFESETIFDGFLANIRDNLRVGGYFVACFFDGKKVFELLKNKKVVEGRDRKSVLWRITKSYTQTTLPSDETGFGLAIKNQFITIGTEHTEYLVPYELLVAKMATIGCLPLMPEDLKALGLQNSTETFQESYTNTVKTKFPMENKAVKEYSFLSRWCIFKRYSGETVKEEEQVVMKSLAAIISEENKENKDKSVLNTLAWRDVSEAESGEPSSAVNQIPKATPKKSRSANLAVLQQGPPGQKPIQSEAVALAGIDARTVDLEPSKEFPKDKVFYFAMQEQNTDVLKDEEGKTLYPDAPRYLAPYYPFTIIDKEPYKANKNAAKREVAYPSILHYMAGMEYKMATNKQLWGEDKFSTEGSIHRNMLEEKLKLDQQIIDKESDQYKERYQALLMKEAREVLNGSPATEKRTIEYKKASWNEAKNEVLRAAYQIRYEKDTKLREIIALLLEKEFYLLYRPSPKLSTTDEWGGITKIGKRNSKNHKGTVIVEGKNRLGQLLMSLGEKEEKIESGQQEQQVEE